MIVYDYMLIRVGKVIDTVKLYQKTNDIKSLFPSMLPSDSIRISIRKEE